MRLLIAILISAVYISSAAALDCVDVELEEQRTIHITHSHPISHDDHAHSSPEPDHDDNVPHSHCVSVGGCSHCLTLPSVKLSLVKFILTARPSVFLIEAPEEPLLASIFRPPIA